MNNIEKITIKKNWNVAGANRVSIHNSTYRQALSYIIQLKRFNVRDVQNKPILINN